MAIDPLRLRKTLAFLLRHRPDIGHLTADAEGWFEAAAVARAVGRLVHARLEPADLDACIREDPRGGFELVAERIRAVQPARGSRRDGVAVPEILYLPCTRGFFEAAHASQVVQATGKRPLRLFSMEQEAWFTAHRRADGEPTVLHVEANRAARAGVAFRRQSPGLYLVDELPTRFVLDLRPGFGTQVSAGGFLVRWVGERIQVGLVRVRRRSGVTWEVAKGKVEIGETPAQTAIRELQEEMGFQAPLEILGELGVSHYGFSTPSGEPRLKELHLFILEARGAVEAFDPARPEGIEQVAFFDAEAAVRVVSHGSLREPVRMLRRWIQAREREGRGGAGVASGALDERPVPAALLLEPPDEPVPGAGED